MKHNSISLAFWIAILVSFIAPGSAYATLEQAKIYKAAFGTEKPKCLTCHIDKLPKKEDGLHEPNDYGKKLMAANPKPDEATYKQVGANPDATF